MPTCGGWEYRPAGFSPAHRRFGNSRIGRIRTLGGPVHHGPIAATAGHPVVWRDNQGAVSKSRAEERIGL